MRRLFFLLLFPLIPLLGAAPDSNQKTSPPADQQQQQIMPQQDSLDDGQRSPPINYQGAFVKMILTLFGLILLIILSVWMLRKIAHGRFQKLNYGRAIKILERRPLSAKSILYVIEVNGKKVLISESQFDVRRLASLSEISIEE